MAKKDQVVDIPEKDENITEIDVSDEMRGSFLEYAVSVIYARALPDARDGLKPVQRRILFQMDQMGLRPDKGHVKSQRVVGEVMGKLHPHGDSAIYEALVRLAQPFNLRVPLVDGHGNFGSLDDGPAAARYTEARMAPAALDLVTGLDEDTVDFVPNYDNQFMQPDVLPAAFPQLLVNGASGIAVGMATNIAPHNLSETIAGAIHLLDNPSASVADLMRYIPGPDLPEGGVIVGLEGIKEAYETGRGAFKTRAKVQIERVTARKMGIIVTQLPYMVGPEKVIEKIKENANAGRLKGISSVQNLTDRIHGLRLVIEVKNGFNPEAVLQQLYQRTPLEDSFSINAVALVGGQPRTLGLKEMLQVFLDHRLDVTTRRSRFRLKKCEDRLHLVEGLLIAILDIDDVIAIIRSSDDAEIARERLMTAFDLSEAQANYILELRLRRLTKFSRIELETERDELLAKIASLREILEDPELLRALVKKELREVSDRLGTPRRTLLLHTDVPAVGLLDPEGTDVVAMGTARGTVKRLRPDVLQRDDWEVIALEDGDRLVGFDRCSDEADLVFISSDAQLLRTPAAKVRPQGRTAGGMAGMKLNPGAEALGFWVVEAPIDAVVVTVAAALGALPGTGQTTVKVTPFECYPSKGRGGQGVRCQRFLRGEDRLDIAWVGTKPARAASADGSPVELPAEDERRDGSGVPITFAIATIG